MERKETNRNYGVGGDTNYLLEIIHKVCIRRLIDIQLPAIYKITAIKKQYPRVEHRIWNVIG